MHSILFVCHGNICRSTMAQFVMEDLVRQADHELDFSIDSAALRSDELGNPPHDGTVRELCRRGIPVGRHRARLAEHDEYNDWDLIVYMDRENERDLDRLFSGDPMGKCVRLTAFAQEGAVDETLAQLRADQVADIEDPWFTGDFDATFHAVESACAGLFAWCLARDRG